MEGQEKKGMKTTKVREEGKGREGKGREGKGSKGNRVDTRKRM